MKFENRWETAGHERLVMLLAKAFLGFAATILFITVFIYWLSGAYYDNLTGTPKIEELLENESLLEGRYEEVNEEQYLGPGGAFAVVTYSGHPVYRSSEKIRPYFTFGELSCIENYGQNAYVDYMSFGYRDGSQQHVFIKHSYTEQNEEIAQMMILDDAFHVISGGFGDRKEIYTPVEVRFLSGTALPGHEYFKCSIPGGKLMLVFLVPERDGAYYTGLMAKAKNIYLLLIPLYIAAFTFFLLWVSYRIKRPLDKLNEAIESFAVGDAAATGTLEGPWEISRIGQTFDQMAVQLAESEAKRREMDVARQRMVADISHDLKTPITVISGYTRAIRDGKIPASEMETYLALIDSRAQHLTGLIESFHELSKVEHPDFTLQTKELDLFEFLREYLADRYSEISFYGMELDADIPEEGSLRGCVDTMQLRRALDNLLYNTLRYNPKGTVVSIQISDLMKEDWNGRMQSWVRISMADNGVGIPEAKRDHVFEPFVRGDDARQGGGSGLGLAISKGIIEAHGGSIALADKSGSRFSTEFEILLPGLQK